LEEIQRQAEALQAKGVAARFIDKDEDAKVVARLIEELREAISRYQVSGYWDTASSTVDVGRSEGRSHNSKQYTTKSWISL